MGRDHIHKVAKSQPIQGHNFMCECRPMSSRRIGRSDSGLGSESGSRYDFGPDEGEDYRQLYHYLTRDGGANGEEIEDFESESGDSQDISSYEAEEVNEQEEFESQAAMAALAQSATESNNQIPDGLMRRIASTLSLSTPSFIKAEIAGAFETPKKLVSQAHEMEMSDEVASAAADLDRCIQVPCESLQPSSQDFESTVSTLSPLHHIHTRPNDDAK